MLKISNTSVNQIEKDLGRTYPRNPFFKGETPGIQKLRRILTAYASYEPEVDYVQGMNFIAG